MAYTPVSGGSYPQNIRYVDDLELYRKRKTSLNVEQGEVHEVHPSATGGSSMALSTAANLPCQNRLHLRINHDLAISQSRSIK